MKRLIGFGLSALVGFVVVAAPVYLDPFKPAPMQVVTPSIIHSVGWKFGRANCGPVASPPGTSLANCNACCNGAVIPTGPLTPGQVTQCLAYCASVYPRPNTSGWWDWFI